MNTYLNHISLGAASLSMIMFALLSEHVFGFAPCSLCLMQRYPHILIVIVSLWLIFFRTHKFFLYPLNTLIMASSILFAFYHVGVEQSIFQGPQSCSASNLAQIGEKSAEALLKNILNTSVVRCNEISWSFIGLSMATWNLIFSIGLFIGWIMSSLRFVMFYFSSSLSK